MSSKLGHTIMQLDDQSIQKCLKEISTVDLARALKGIEGKTQIKVFKNLPKRSAAILQETVEHLDLMRDSEMNEAQEKILLIISGLEDQGDLLVAN
jgi:flagellar motor switch protein FliG